MKRGISISALIAALIILAGFSAGQSALKEKRDVKGFSRVSFGGSGNLYINIGPEYSVVLEGDKDVLEDIITEVSDDKLVIRKDRWSMNMNEKVTAYITMPLLTGLGISGSGRAEIKDVVKSTGLDLNVSGSGKIYTSDVTVSSLRCSISGSGDIILGSSGNANRAEISISGSGNYTGEHLNIGSAEINISGSGSCKCNVDELLKAIVSGSGHVAYEGNPKIDARISGSGRVRSN